MLTTLLFLAAAGAAKGQPAPPVYDPQLAYVKPGSRSSELYLANADGSNPKRVFAKSGAIDAVDFSPAGNLLAYSDEQGVQLLSFSAGPNGISVGAPWLVAPGGTTPDFSDDGSRIIYRHPGSDSIRFVPTTGGAPTTLYTGICSSPRWLRSSSMGNAFACAKPQPGTPIVYQVWTFLLDGANQVVSSGPVVSSDSQPFDTIDERIDVARSRNAVVIVTDFPSYPSMVEVNLETGATTARGAGRGAHYTRGDAKLVSLSPYASTGSVINSTDVATGTTTAIARKGTYGAIDTHP